MKSNQHIFSGNRYFGRLAVIVAMAVFAVGCGSSEADPTASSTTPDIGTDTSSTVGTSAETAFATSALPEGLRPWWESTNRTAKFMGSNYLLAASADDGRGEAGPGITVLRFDQPNSWESVDVPIPDAVSSANIFMSGSRLIVSYLDPAGAIIVSSSDDGVAFDAARLAIPARYVEADSWSHTSLVGSLVGAADLDADAFAVANTGITWPRPDDLARPYAIEQNPDNAESIRYANTIRTNPTDDGDFLFIYEKDGEVVAEVLASDAGIEDGYIEAYRDRDDDTFESQSWLINGSTATNLNTAPFNGMPGIRVHSLYPVNGGVGAMVTDFNAEANAEDASLLNGATADRGLHTPGVSAVRTGTLAQLRAMITLDGILWTLEVALGATNPQFGSLAWAEFGGIPLFVLAFFAEGEAQIAVSDDGAAWATADYILDIDLGGGNEVQVIVAGETTTHIYTSADGSYREYNVEYDGSGGDAYILPVHQSEIPELQGNNVAVRTTPTAAEMAAIEEAHAADLSLGFFGDILFGMRPPGY